MFYDYKSNFYERICKSTYYESTKDERRIKYIVVNE